MIRARALGRLNPILRRRVYRDYDLSTGDKDVSRQNISSTWQQLVALKTE